MSNPLEINMETTKATKKKASKKVAKKVTPQPQEETKELPIIVTMGIYKDEGKDGLGKGWRFIEIHTQGDHIIQRTETSYATRRTIVFDEFKVKAFKHYLRQV